MSLLLCKLCFERTLLQVHAIMALDEIFYQVGASPFFCGASEPLSPYDRGVWAVVILQLQCCWRFICGYATPTAVTESACAFKRAQTSVQTFV